ncbi:DUF5317 domain-containing protein [Microbacteriaceae bacterium 4G12]
MVFDGIFISLLVGFLRKGNLKGLADLRLKGGIIFPLLLLIEVLVFNFQNKFMVVKNFSNFIYIFIYIIGLLFLYMNRKQSGFSLIFIGVLLNFIVIVTNGGRMPVSLEAASILDPMYTEVLKEGVYAKHQALTASTHFAFLGDIIPITKPYPKTQVVSIGDIVMNIGIFIFIQRLMIPKKQLSSLKGGETT